jgi:hypothetical protein
MKSTSRVRISARTLTALAIATAALASTPAAADPIPPGWTAQNMDVLGYTVMDGHPAFKISITKANGRYYLIAGHYNIPGWSVIDVTDPKDPKVVKFIPGPANTSTIQVDIADGILVAGLAAPSQLSLDAGLDRKKPYEGGVILFDIKDPLNPKELGRWHTDNPLGVGTHRNMYTGGRYGHLSAEMKGFSGNIYVILDISDPAHIKEAGRFWMPGQNVAAGETPPKEPDPIIHMHNPDYIDADGHVWLSYGDAGMVGVDISDVTHPKLFAQLKVTHDMFSVHTIVADPKRKLAFINSEATNYDCKGPMFHATVVDMTDPARPVPIARYPSPIPPAGLPYTSFCDKGGRFGPHNMNQLQYNPLVEKQGNLSYLTWFNAGLRVYDVSKPRDPREIASFVPALPQKLYMPSYGNFVRVEDVLADDRGIIYISGGAQQGIYTLKYTGPVKN